MKKISVKIALLLITLLGLLSCSSVSLTFTSSSAEIKPSTSAYRTALWEGNALSVWNKLQQIPPSTLSSMQSQPNDSVQAAWLDLALISKQNSLNTPQLATRLMAWRERNPAHPGNQLLPNNAVLMQLQNTQPPRQIALLLPEHGNYASSGQRVREGFLNSYYAAMPKTNKQNIKFYDTTQAQNMAILYQQAVSEGADFVIGPLVKDNVQQLSRHGSFSEPTLALNYTDTGWGALPAHFYEFGLLPEDEIIQMAEHAREKRLSRAMIIAPQNEWGGRLVAAFSARWQALGGTIRETWYYNANADFNHEIARLLKVTLNPDKNLMGTENNKTILTQPNRHDFNVIFLFAQPAQARMIIPLLKYYSANEVAIFATSSIHSSDNLAKNIDLNGVIICDIPGSKNATSHPSDPQADRLYAVGKDAHLLSQTLPRLIALPYFPLYGATGAITLSSSQQIHRRLPCNTINDGHL